MGTFLGFTAFYFLDRKLFDLAVLMFRIDLFAYRGGIRFGAPDVPRSG